MANTTQSKTELSELGEFGLIRRLTENIVLKNESTIKGVGDDCVLGNWLVMCGDINARKRS
ncbi:MAG: hypothetical protein WCJ95_02920, partial [Mariniphaga sp.]